MSESQRTELGVPSTSRLPQHYSLLPVSWSSLECRGRRFRGALLSKGWWRSWMPSFGLYGSTKNSSSFWGVYALCGCAKNSGKKALFAWWWRGPRSQACRSWTRTAQSGHSELRSGVRRRYRTPRWRAKISKSRRRLSCCAFLSPPRAGDGAEQTQTVRVMPDIASKLLESLSGRREYTHRLTRCCW